MGLGPYNQMRGYIVPRPPVPGHDDWQTPYSNRSTYAHVVEYDMNGPTRIESMFSMGESGDIRLHFADPVFNPNFFSMNPGLRPLHADTVPDLRLKRNNQKGPALRSGAFF